MKLKKKIGKLSDPKHIDCNKLIPLIILIIINSFKYALYLLNCDMILAYCVWELEYI